MKNETKSGRKPVRIIIINVCIVASIIGGFYYYISPELFPYSKLKNEISRDVGWDGLQRWAIDILNTKSPGEIDIVGAPGIIRQQMCHIEYRGKSEYDDEYILVACGSGHYHWGLCIGRPGFVLKDPPLALSEKIADGIWGIRE